MTAPSQTFPAQPQRLSAATDGQGVILAVAYSSDARQRTSADLLARRVAHRLGCPVAVGQIQRGTLLADGSLRTLHDRGARRVVVAPAVLTAAADLQPGPRTLAHGAALNMTFAMAEPLGGDPLLLSGILELLSRSERSPQPDTPVRIVLPWTDASVAAEVARSTCRITEAGWGPAEVRVLDPSGELRRWDRDCGAGAPTPSTDPCDLADRGTGRHGRRRKRIVLPLSVLAGPFAARVAHCAEADGDEVIQQTLHATDACTRLIATRVVEARRR